MKQQQKVLKINMYKRFAKQTTVDDRLSGMSGT
jgi:hypothetical protein